MPLTAEQLAERRGYLGASDVPVVLGLNPWKSPFELWCEKTGRLDQPDPKADMRKANTGLRMEPLLARWLADELGSGASVVENTRTFRHDKHIFLAANPDFLVHMQRGSGPAEALGEAKTSGITDGWGDDGTDQVPDVVAAQVVAQMACMPGIPLVHVVRMLPDRYDWVPHRYVVPRDEEAIGLTIEVCVRWWVDHVKADKPPSVEAQAPSLECVKRLRRVDGPAARLDFENDIKPWLDKRADRLRLEKEEKDELARLLARLGETRVAVCDEGEFIYAEESAGRRVDVDALKLHHPLVYDSVSKPATRQVPRWKASKALAGTGRAGGSRRPAAVRDEDPFATT